MARATHSPLRSVAAHAILLTYTLIALFPVLLIVVIVLLVFGGLGYSRRGR